MADDALQRRMFDAQQRREAALGRRMTLAEIGQGVAERLGGEPAAPSVVRRWLKGVEPKEAVATYRALADVFGVPASWLVFGEGSPEPVASAPNTATPAAPPGYPREVITTPEQDARAAREAAAGRAKYEREEAERQEAERQEAERRRRA